MQLSEVKRGKERRGLGSNFAEEATEGLVGELHEQQCGAGLPGVGCSGREGQGGAGEGECALGDQGWEVGTGVGEEIR